MACVSPSMETINRLKPASIKAASCFGEVMGVGGGGAVEVVVGATTDQRVEFWMQQRFTLEIQTHG